MVCHLHVHYLEIASRADSLETRQLQTSRISFLPRNVLSRIVRKPISLSVLTRR